MLIKWHSLNPITHIAMSTKLDLTALNDAVQKFDLANQQQHLVKLFEHYGLVSYLIGFDEVQPDEDGPVYHGIMHSYMTALNCLEGSIHTGLGNSEKRAMLVAGLYHDVLHSRGQFSDNINISVAVKQLEAIHARVPEHLKLKPEELKIAITAIRQSKYLNGRYVSSKPSVYGAILQDADRMGAYCTNDEELVGMWVGLYNEIDYGRRYNFEPPLSAEQFMEMQSNFHSSVKWNTKWATVKAMKLNWPNKWKNGLTLLWAQPQFK